MNEKTLKFGDVEVSKRKIYLFKQPTCLLTLKMIIYFQNIMKFGTKLRRY